jgi:hypothetical protein
MYAEVAHYTEQWQKIMISDLDRDAKGFSVPGEHLPRGLAPSANAESLLEVARRHVTPGSEGEGWLSPPHGQVLISRVTINPSNTWQFAHEVESINEHRITLLTEGTG